MKTKKLTSKPDFEFDAIVRRVMGSIHEGIEEGIKKYIVMTGTQREKALLEIIDTQQIEIKALVSHINELKGML